MIDWTLFWLDIIKGTIVGFITFVGGMYLFNKYVLPKLLVKQGSSMIKQATEDENIKPYIDQGKKIVEDVAPIIEKLKKIDIDGFVELINSLKKIDPQKINVIIDGVKNFVEGLAAKSNSSVPPPPPMENNASLGSTKSEAEYEVQHNRCLLRCGPLQTQKCELENRPRHKYYCGRSKDGTYTQWDDTVADATEN